MGDQEMVSPNPALHAPEEQAPVLPQKSALRASRLLDNLVGLKLTMPADPPAFTQTPHDEYLSSEEEASSTAGDFSDFEYDSSSDDISPTPSKDRKSHEDTARVVSVIFSGKPSVVNVPQNRRSTSPISLDERQTALGLESHKIAGDVEVRRRSMSVSTTSSGTTCTRPMVVHPPRSSSMQPPNTQTTLQKEKPFFLQIDPYASGSTYSLGSHQEPKAAEDEERPKTPRTPTQIFRGVARSLSLMKRRSTPRMNQSFLSPSNERLPLPASPSHLSIAEEPLVEEEPQEETVEETTEEITTVVSAPPAPERPPPVPISAPVTYDEIVRVAKRNEKAQKLLGVAQTPTSEPADSPLSPMSPLSTASTNTTATSGKRISSFNAARRRMSVKLTGKFQL